VANILRAHIPHFSFAGRQIVSNALLDAFLNPRNSDACLWDIYIIYHALFDEAGRELRTCFLRGFLDRNRTDMAAQALKNMKDYYRADVKPIVDTYILVFNGIAKAHDDEALKQIHNLLKVDMSLDPDRKLWNALMRAYFGCKDPRRVIELWDDLMSTLEGPDETSVALALDAAKYTPEVGDIDRIWQVAVERNLTKDSVVIANLIAALTKKGKIEEAKEIASHAKEKYNVYVDASL